MCVENKRKKKNHYRVQKVSSIFREIVGPTANAKRNIMKGKVRSLFSLITDDHVMKHIIKCTQEAYLVLGN